MTDALKVKVIVQAGQTLLLGGKYHGEGKVLELDSDDAKAKETAGVVKPAVFIGTDPADLQAAIDASTAAASVASQLPEQVATGLSQAIGSLQLAAKLDEALPQTSASGSDAPGGDATSTASNQDATTATTEQTGNQGTEAAADAAAQGTGAADGSDADAAAAGSAPAGDVAGDPAQADTAAAALAAPATKARTTKAKA
jgi:hypothetical protein